MINTFKHLRQELNFSEEELKYILTNLGKYYYRAESTKTKYGGPQPESNGVKKIRILHPSTGRLKEVQQKIHTNILSRLPIPDYAFGSMKGKSNILNAKQHLGINIFLLQI